MSRIHDAYAVANPRPPAYPQVARALDTVRAVMDEHFPELRDALLVALAVIAAKDLSDYSLPTSVWLCGPPSAGKSLVLTLLFPADAEDSLNADVYRCDGFTRASFVSHRADLTGEQLGKIDLLPRVAGKVLITKELAPLCRGRRDELTSCFATIASVLDGHGHSTDTGAQGQRGYTTGDLRFQWLGATTPLPPETMEIMAGVGPRILFYDIDREARTPAELAGLLLRGPQKAGEARAKEATRALLRELNALVQAGKPTVSLSDAAALCIATWASALGRLRTHIPITSSRGNSAPDAEEDLATGDPIPTGEHAERVARVLGQIAMGSALIHGRDYIDAYDLAQIAHTALSSGVSSRQRIFAALLDLGGTAETPQIAERTGLSLPTVRGAMRDLAKVGLVEPLLPRRPGGAKSVALTADYQLLVTVPRLRTDRP